jgi:DNA-binding NarL/FixJ family response regulator
MSAVEQPERIRVLVVDDHDVFRTGLASLLGAEPDIEIVAQASGGRAGVRLTDELQPDVVLMDLRMPDLDGAAATRAILDNDGSTRVVALAVVTDESAVAEAVEAGSCGFLAKDTPIDGVVAAIHAAALGAAWLSPHAAEVVLGHLRRNGGNTYPDDTLLSQLSDDTLLSQLSARELGVLRLIGGGMENDKIAKALGISRGTVKNHVSNILAKLGLPSRVQAAIYAVRRGLT